MVKNVSEMTPEQCRKVVVKMMEKGYPQPPMDYRFDYLLARQVRKGILTMEDINTMLEAA